MFNTTNQSQTSQPDIDLRRTNQNCKFVFIQSQYEIERLYDSGNTIHQIRLISPIDERYKQYIVEIEETNA